MQRARSSRSPERREELQKKKRYTFWCRPVAVLSPPVCQIDTLMLYCHAHGCWLYTCTCMSPREPVCRPTASHGLWTTCLACLAQFNPPPRPCVSCRLPTMDMTHRRDGRAMPHTPCAPGRAHRAPRRQQSHPSTSLCTPNVRRSSLRCPHNVSIRPPSESPIHLARPIHPSRRPVCSRGVPSRSEPLAVAPAALVAQVPAHHCGSPSHTRHHNPHLVLSTIKRTTTDMCSH
jgi:hypothetical protein